VPIFILEYRPCLPNSSRVLFILKDVTHHHQTPKMPDTKTYQLPPTGEMKHVHELLAIAYMDGIS
jgi:hypothetical protein